MSQGQATHRNLRELPLAGKTVLVLEDELPIALSIESDLRDAGAAVVELVRSTIEARRTIRGSAAFDAAVVDLHLADGNASPLIQVLSERGIPVVVTTGALIKWDSPNLSQAVAILRRPHPEGELAKAVACMIMEGTDRRTLPGPSTQEA